MFNLQALEETGKKVVAFIDTAEARMQVLLDRLNEAHTKLDSIMQQLSEVHASHESIMGWIAESDDDSLADILEQTQEAAATVAGAAVSVAEAATEIASTA